MFWRIGRHFINTDHIVLIDLNTLDYDYEVNQQVPAISISLSVATLEFGQVHDNTGSGEPMRLVYKCNQADFLRPLIVEAMYNGKIYHIGVDLPELVLPDRIPESWETQNKSQDGEEFIPY